jgi:hypothetical protein
VQAAVAPTLRQRLYDFLHRLRPAQRVTQQRSGFQPARHQSSEAV